MLLAAGGLVACSDGECRGSKRAETIVGNSGDGEIFAFAGDDVIFRDRGRDVVHAGAGNDQILQDFDDLDGDVIFAGPSNDVVFVGDNSLADIVDCGPGKDQVHFDEGLDTIANCERQVIV